MTTTHQQKPTEQQTSADASHQAPDYTHNPIPASTLHANDPDASFHQQPEKWHFNGHRTASTPASDVGEHASHTSRDDQQDYEQIEKETKGMNSEQVRAYLNKRPHIDGDRIMRGRKNDGYMGLTGAMSGTM